MKGAPEVGGCGVSGLFLEDLSVGQSAELSRTVAGSDLEAFAAVTGDDNPVHLDEAYAATTPFGGRIAHGMLSAGYISAVIGTRLPGPGAIYVSQSLRFRRPVKIGDTVTARAEITAIDTARARVTLQTTCLVAGKAVLEGEAEVMVPRREA
jgi:3-hydroxybutyryl-CoA dehydratase